MPGAECLDLIFLGGLNHMDLVDLADVFAYAHLGHTNAAVDASVGAAVSKRKRGVGI